jgi:hypothetical protein
MLVQCVAGDALFDLREQDLTGPRFGFTRPHATALLALITTFKAAGMHYGKDLLKLVRKMQAPQTRLPAKLILTCKALNEELGPLWRQLKRDEHTLYLKLCAAAGMQLSNAAKQGDAATVRMMLSKPGAESFINYQDADESTPLHFAVVHQHAAVSKQLIKARCNVDLQSKLGAAPLHICAEIGDASVNQFRTFFEL